jgi:hypothetical protein
MTTTARYFSSLMISIAILVGVLLPTTVACSDDALHPACTYEQTNVCTLGHNECIRQCGDGTDPEWSTCIDRCNTRQCKCLDECGANCSGHANPLR